MCLLFGGVSIRGKGLSIYDIYIYDMCVCIYIYTQIISPCYNPIPNTKPTLGDGYGYDLSSESTPH